MRGLVKKLTKKVPPGCLSRGCERDGCSISMDGTPSSHLIIDLDCDELGITDETRCDYVVVFEEDSTTCVVPIELKGGGVSSVTHVIEQLEGGTALVAGLLIQDGISRFVPVLAHKKQIHRRDLIRLRKKKIKLHNHKEMIRTVKCGNKLADVIKQTL